MMQVYDRDGAIKCVVLDPRCYYTAEEIKAMREAGYRVKVDGKNVGRKSQNE